MAKAAIIIAIYNVKSYLMKGIESSVHQTEKDIEVILVDDGSTDGSAELCDHYAVLDSRVKVIHKRNGGLASARNAGAEAATADYVMFLDGDDYLREDAVECCLKAMQVYPCDFVQYLYQEVVEGQAPERRESTGEIYQASTSRELFENLYRLGGVAASGATKFMRRSLALEIPFENIRHEDEMWCTRAFQRKLTATYLPEELYYYVTREGSIIHSSFNRKKLDVFEVIDERLKVLKELGLNDFLRLEYRKQFLMIIRFYVEAKDAGATEGVRHILNVFEINKKDIQKYGALSGKFALLFRGMMISPRLAELYRLYWKVRGV